MLLYALIGLNTIRPDFPFWLAVLFVGLTAFLLLFIWVRFGLLATIASRLVYMLVLDYPIDPDLSAWYSGATLFAVFAVVGLALYGFFTSTAGQPWFREEEVPKP